MRSHNMLKTKSQSSKGTVSEPKSLIEEAYRKIKQLIFQQKLVPGQRLVYDDLGQMLNMSRTPVINALNRLEQQGLVVSESFRGFYVKPMDVQEAWDAFGLREALETYAVQQAIAHGSVEDFAKLEESLLTHQNYMPNFYNRKKIFLDAQFHMQIAEMTRNRILKWQIKTNLEHVYLRANLENYNVERMAAATREHNHLLARMKKKDTIASVDIIRNHVRNARDHVIACLSNSELAEDEYHL